MKLLPFLLLTIILILFVEASHLEFIDTIGIGLGRESKNRFPALFLL